MPHEQTRAAAAIRRYYYWRLVLIGRKVSFLAAATFAKGNPMFQSSLAITIISVAYALHAMMMPFVSPLEQHALVLTRVQQRGGTSDMDEAAGTDRGARASTARAIQAQARKHRRSSIVAIAASTGATLTHITDFNVLESVLLLTCFGVLLGGAVFKSAVFKTGDAMDWALTVVIFSVLLAAFGVFAWMIVQELRRAFEATAIRAKASREERARAKSAAARAEFKRRNRFSFAAAVGFVRQASSAALFGPRRRSGATPVAADAGRDGLSHAATAPITGSSSKSSDTGSGGGSRSWRSQRALLAGALSAANPTREPGTAAAPASITDAKAVETKSCGIPMAGGSITDLHKVDSHAEAAVVHGSVVSNSRSLAALGGGDMTSASGADGIHGSRMVIVPVASDAACDVPVTAVPTQNCTVAIAAATAASRIQAARRASVARRKYTTIRDAAVLGSVVRLSARDGGNGSRSISSAASGATSAGFMDSRRAQAAARIQAARRGSVVRRQFLDTGRTAAGAAPGPSVGCVARGVRAAAGSAGIAPRGVTAPVNRLSYVSPSGWQLFVDADDGDEFYYNTNSLASQRQVPPDYKYISPAGWTEYVDEECDRYYYNVHTEAVTWERPSDHE